MLEVTEINLQSAKVVFSKHLNSAQHSKFKQINEQAINRVLTNQRMQAGL